MKFIKEFFLGIRTYRKATGLLFTKQLWWFILFPIAIYLLLFSGGNVLTNHLIDPFREWVIESTNVNNLDPEKWGWLAKLIKGIVYIAFKIVFFIIFAAFSGYIVMILMAPVYALLSEKVEGLLNEKDYPFEWKQFFKDIARGIGLALRNAAYEMVFALLLLVIGLIPVIGWFTSLTLFFISAYFYGFSFMDYSMERKRLGYKSSINFVRQHKGLAMGNGLIFALLLFIPKIGILLAAFTSLISVIAATLALERMNPDEELEKFKAIDNTDKEQNVLK